MNQMHGFLILFIHNDVFIYVFLDLDHCAMKELGLQYKHERSEYERMARLWTINFAR